MGPEEKGIPLQYCSVPIRYNLVGESAVFFPRSKWAVASQVVAGKVPESRFAVRHAITKRCRATANLVHLFARSLRSHFRAKMRPRSAAPERGVMAP